MMLISATKHADTAGTNSAELVLLVQTEMLFLEIK